MQDNVEDNEGDDVSDHGDRPQHWYSYRPCPFPREEVEAMNTYVYGTLSWVEGDEMMRWACNEAYDPKKIRFSNIRSLATAVMKEYVPEGVKSINFHEKLDGKQSGWFHSRSLLPCIKRLLARPGLAPNQYTRFKLLKNKDGIRVIGSLNTGDWYEFAQVKAQEMMGDDRTPVSIVPLLGSTDVTLCKKDIPFYPYFTSLGCIGDDQRSEPTNWILVACLPWYNGSAAKLAGRKPNGPFGVQRRKVC